MDAGNYTILARLSESTLGGIYEGVHQKTQERVVVRILPTALSKEQNILGRLLALQRALGRLEPERRQGSGEAALAAILECGRMPDGALYIVSEFVSGESLATQLQRHAGLPLPNKALRLGQRLSASLALAHASSIYHLALRPAKLLLTQSASNPDAERPKILDVGLLTALGRTPRPDESPPDALPYLAPEFLRGEAVSGGPADVHALGVILYQMGSGTLPNRVRDADQRRNGDSQSGAEAQTALMQMLPSWLQPFAELLDRMLAPVASERPTMAQVAQTLQQLVALAPNPSASSLPPSSTTPKMPQLPSQRSDGSQRQLAVVSSPAALAESLTEALKSDPPTLSASPEKLAMLAAQSSRATPQSARTPSGTEPTPQPTPPPPPQPSQSATTPGREGVEAPVEDVVSLADTQDIPWPPRRQQQSQVTPRTADQPTPLPMPIPEAHLAAAEAEQERIAASQSELAPIEPQPAPAEPQAAQSQPQPAQSQPQPAQSQPQPAQSQPQPAPAEPPPAVTEPPAAISAAASAVEEPIVELELGEEPTLSSEPTRMSTAAPARAAAAPETGEIQLDAEYTLDPRRDPGGDHLAFAPTGLSLDGAPGTGGGRTAATPVEPGLGGGATLRVGQLVGNFRIVSKIGQGGMGAVYAAVHRQIGRRAAVKVLHGPLARTADYSARFLNEARAVNILRHPNLVEIFDFGQLPDGTLYIIMEFLEGESLRAKLRRSHKLPETMAVELALQMAKALESAHQKGIVHRDLKPENVMLVADPVHAEEDRIKILDFGIAKVGPAQSGPSSEPDSQEFQTAVGTTMGTPKYMAPEQYGDASKVDGKADVFALGVMLYEMLSGQVPFPKTSLAAFHQSPLPLIEVAPTVSPKLATLIHRMLTPKAAERPNMREALEQLTPPPPPPPLPPPTPQINTMPPPVAPSSHIGWLTLAFFLIAAALTGTAAYKGWLRPPPPPPMVPENQQADLEIDVSGPKARALGVLYQGLKSSNPTLRGQAARALGQSRDVAQWSSISSLLKDPTPSVQAEAAEALGQLGSSDAHADLLAALDSNLPPGVRVSVAGALARLVHPRGAATLRELLSDSNERVRLLAALYLLETGDTKAAAPLQAALSQGSLPEETVVHVLGRLAQAGNSQAQQQLNARMAGDGFGRRRVLAAGQLARIGDERARSLLSQGMQKSGQQQLPSALALATVGDTSGYELFKNTAIDARQPTPARQLAIDGLGACGRRQGAVLLASILDETAANPELRQVAAGAILQITGGDPTQIASQSLSWAQAALGHDDYLIRQAATTVLADLDSEQAVPLLTRALGDAQREVRRSAATALGQRSARSALYALRSALNDAEPEVRQAGLSAMVNLLATLGAAGTRATDAQTRARLQQLVESGTPEEQLIASATLYRLGDGAQLERLRLTLASPNPVLRKLVVETVADDAALLKQALGDSDGTVRFLAARRLALLGQRDGVAVLRAALAAGGAESIVAYGLLKKLGEKEAPPAAFAELLGRDGPTSLAVLDVAADLPAKEALPLLNKARFDLLPGVRRKVAEVAAGLYKRGPDKELLSVIYSLLNDSDVDVRTRSGSLLNRLMRPTVVTPEPAEPDLGPIADLGAPPDLATDGSRGTVRIVGEQWLRFQLDQQPAQTLGPGGAELHLEPGRHSVSYTGGSLEVSAVAGSTVVATLPVTYLDQLLGDAADLITRRDVGRAQQLLERARAVLVRGRGSRTATAELLLQQARIYELAARWEDSMKEVQTLIKLPESQRKAEQTASASALIARLDTRIGRIRIYKESEGRCLVSDQWVRPGEHSLDQGSGESRVVRVRAGASVEVKLCQPATPQ